MFYDLSVPWTSADDPELQRTVAFLDELGYNVVALNHTLTGKIPNKATCPIPKTPFPSHPNIRFLTRVTVILDDHGQNYGLPALSNLFDIVAVRPTSEKLLAQACQSLECDIISLDSSIRHPYHFKAKTLGLAIARGLRFEISYGSAVGADANHRRNVISNAVSLVKATKGKGIIASSEAKRCSGVRAPYDVINLSTLWGLSQDQGRGCVADNPRLVVVQAAIRRRSFRGVIDVVDPGGGGGGKEQDVGNGKEVGSRSRTDTPMTDAAPTPTQAKGKKGRRKQDGANVADTEGQDKPMTDAPAGKQEKNHNTAQGKKGNGQPRPMQKATQGKPKQGDVATEEESPDKPMTDISTPTSQAQGNKGKRKQDEANVTEEESPEKLPGGEVISGDVAGKKDKQSNKVKRPSKKQRLKEMKKAATGPSDG